MVTETYNLLKYQCFINYC